MSIDYNAVVEVVRAELAALDGVYEGRLRWENDGASPPEPTEMYIEESFLPFAEVPASTGYDRLTAEVRYTVVMPRGAGVDEGRRLAVQIRDLFPVGKSMVGKTTVVVDGSEILSGRVKDEARYAMPVSVMVRTEALRNPGG